MGGMYELPEMKKPANGCQALSTKKIVNNRQQRQAKK